MPDAACTGIWRRHPDSNRGIRVLQTLALPLGYAAIPLSTNGLPVRRHFAGYSAVYRRAARLPPLSTHEQANVCRSMCTWNRYTPASTL